MDLKSVRRSDILLAIIAAAGERDLTRVFAQKVAFLIGDEFEGLLCDDFYKFEKREYGPYSREVYHDAEMLNDAGCIRIIYGAERREDRYKIAVDCDLAAIQLPADLQESIQETVDWVIDMSFAELLRAIYMLYPAYLEKSRFDYDESEAIAEAFARSVKDMRAGRTYSAEEGLAKLRKAMARHGQKDQMVSRVRETTREAVETIS